MYSQLYPAPASMKETGGIYALPLHAVLRVNPGAVSPARAEEVKGLWNRFCFTAAKLEIQEEAALPAFTACMGEADVSLEPEDQYAVKVSDRGLCIKGKTDQDLLYGLFTLMQTIQPLCLDDGKEALCIACEEIHDHAAMPLRMVHVCVFPETTLFELEKTIRLCAFSKVTHVVLEFWATIQLDCFRENCWSDVFFTKAQIRDLVLLANALGVEIIPMVNHLGHASHSRGLAGRHSILDQNPNLALLFEPDGWTWCLSNPQVPRLLKAMRDELMDLCGPGEYFHLGCDEAYSFASCPLCRKKNRTELLTEYLNGLAEDLASKGRRGIIWGDALLDTERWKSPYIATSRPDQKSHLALEKLDRRLIIADWQYNIVEPKLETAAFFKEQGFDTLACPWNSSPGNTYALAEAASQLELPGVMITTWNHLSAMLRLINVDASVAWTGSREKYNMHGVWAEAATLLRKIMPVAGSFEKAGFLPEETEPLGLRQVY